MSLHQGREEQKTSSGRRENLSENMRMSEFMSEFVTMRDEVHVVMAKSTRRWTAINESIS